MLLTSQQIHIASHYRHDSASATLCVLPVTATPTTNTTTSTPPALPGPRRNAGTAAAVAQAAAKLPVTAPSFKELLDANVIRPGQVLSVVHKGATAQAPLTKDGVAVFDGGCVNRVQQPRAFLQAACLRGDSGS